MPQIVFSSKVAKFKDLADRVLPRDKRYQICFEDDSLKKSFEELLMHICPICPNKPIFRTFKQLDTHVRREHERFYCELCTTDLKVNTRAVLNFSLIPVYAGTMKFRTSKLLSTNDITFDKTAFHFALPAYAGAIEGLKWPRIYCCFKFHESQQKQYSVYIQRHL